MLSSSKQSKFDMNSGKLSIFSYAEGWKDDI